jgi:serine/threonine-protein kinase HipA
MIVEVKLWGNTVGAVAWDMKRHVGVFEFYESFTKLDLDIAPGTMPLADLKRGRLVYSFPELDTKTFEGLPGLLADALPDAFGNSVLRAWLRTQNRDSNSLTPLEKLSYIGSRSMGALTFQPSAQVAQPVEEVEVEKLLDLTSRVMSQKEGVDFQLSIEEEDAMMDLIKVGTSAGGMRPKAIIAYSPETKSVKSGQLDMPAGYHHYLLKFDGVSEGSLGDPKGYGRSEMAYYAMAKDCGIEMMPSELLEENGRAHFMTQRFDRAADGERIHMQTLCALAHFDYNQPGVYDYEDAFEEMRALGLSYQDTEALYRRMLFNIVARNQDDHTKNISFLMEQQGNWKLSPAYDLTWSYNPAGAWTNVHQMSVNGKRDHFTKAGLLETGKRQSIKSPEQILAQVVDTVNQWSVYSQQHEVPENLSYRIRESHRLKWDS